MINVDIVQADMALIDEYFAATWPSERDIHPFHNVRLSLLLDLNGSGHSALPGLMVKNGAGVPAAELTPCTISSAGHLVTVRIRSRVQWVGECAFAAVRGL